MRLLQASVLATALWWSQASAQTPRLSVWFTDPIGASNAEQCVQPAWHTNSQLEALRTRTTYRLDDIDVALWEPSSAKWTLHDSSLTARERAWKMADRCFILWIDGKPAASGVALWSHSARMVDMPVLAIDVKAETLSLRLGARHGGPDSVPVARESIASVLEAKRRYPEAKP